MEDLSVLREPLRLGGVVVVVFFWLWCIQHANRQIKVSESTKPYVNTAVLVGGPVAWTVLMFVHKAAEAGNRFAGSWTRLKN